MARELSGTLGRNQEHEPGSNRPEFKGQCLVGGVEYWISGSVAENERGKYFGLVFEPKELPKDERPASGSPQLQAKYAPKGNGNGRCGYSPRQMLDDEVTFMCEWR